MSPREIRAIGEVNGVSGVMFTFQDYLVDLDRFGRQVMPLLAGQQQAA